MSHENDANKIKRLPNGFLCRIASSMHAGCYENFEKRKSGHLKVMAKEDGREVGFQDGGCFLRFLKRERINNQTFITFLNCG